MGQWPIRRGRPGVPAGWNPETGIIWLDDRLTPTEQRCSIVHETLHAERGHQFGHGWLETHQERQVQADTARLLVTVEALAEHVAWCRSEHELAEALDVTRDVLRIRLSQLTPGERAMLAALVERAA